MYLHHLYLRIKSKYKSCLVLIPELPDHFKQPLHFCSGGAICL